MEPKHICLLLPTPSNISPDGCQNVVHYPTCMPQHRPHAKDAFSQFYWDFGGHFARRWYCHDLRHLTGLDGWRVSEHAWAAVRAPHFPSIHAASWLLLTSPFCLVLSPVSFAGSCAASLNYFASALLAFSDQSLGAFFCIEHCVASRFLVLTKTCFLHIAQCSIAYCAHTSTTVHFVSMGTLSRFATGTLPVTAEVEQ